MAGLVKYSYNTVNNQNMLPEPQGLSIDANFLYVAGRWSHNVHQITSEPTHIHVESRNAPYMSDILQIIQQTILSSWQLIERRYLCD